MVFEDMTISVAADVRDAVVGLELLSNRTDEFSDEADEASRSASSLSLRLASIGPTSLTASGGLGTLAVTAAAAGTSMFTLTAAAGGMLVPLAAAAAGAGALAAAFGGLLAVGAVTHVAEIRHALSDMRTEILSLLQPLGEEFGPMIVEAVRSMDDLVENVLAAIGPVEEFKETLRLFGGIAFRTIPDVVGWIFDLARSLQDELRAGMLWLANNGPRIVEALGDSWKELRPEVMAFGTALADLAPDLGHFAVIAADELLPVLTGAVNILNWFLEGLRDTPEWLQRAAVWVGTLAGAITTLVTSLSKLGRFGGGGGLLGGGGLSKLFKSLGRGGGGILSLFGRGAKALPRVGGGGGLGFPAIAPELARRANDLRKALGNDSLIPDNLTGGGSPGGGVAMAAAGPLAGAATGGLGDIDTILGTGTAATTTAQRSASDARPIEINIRRIEASGRREGEEAADAMMQKLSGELWARNIIDTSYGRTP